MIEDITIQITFPYYLETQTLYGSVQPTDSLPKSNFASLSAAFKHLLHSAG